MKDIEYIIAIDPGVTKTGLSILRGMSRDYKVKYVHVINKYVDWWQTVRRIELILEDLLNELKLKKATVVIEEPINYYRGGNKVVTQCMFTGALLQVFRGIECKRALGELLDDIEFKIYLVSPTTAKLALTEIGNAKKPQMVRNARYLFPNIRWDDFSKLNQEAIADSLGIGLAKIKQLNGVRRIQ